MKTKLLGVVAACVLALSFMAASPCPVSAATVTYTDGAAYFADAGHQTLQDFDNPISTTDTSVRYPNLLVSCSGSSFCNATSFGFRIDAGNNSSIFSTSPSLVTFTFNSPIKSFGISVYGLGTILPGSTNFSISNSNGFSSVLFSNYSNPTNEILFAGLISDERFTSVTLWGTQIGDGVFFDNLYYHQNPLPPALPLFATGLGLLGLLGLFGWRRKRKQAA